MTDIHPFLHTYKHSIIFFLLEDLKTCYFSKIGLFENSTPKHYFFLCIWEVKISQISFYFLLPMHTIEGTVFGSNIRNRVFAGIKC